MKRRAMAVLFGLATLGTLALIWYLTTQSPYDTSALSGGVVRRLHDWALRLANGHLPDSELRERVTVALAWVSVHIRKVAHTVEFLPVGFFACASLIAWRGRRWRAWSIIALAAIVCAAASVGDQVHKMYVPGRYFDATDLPWDVAGYMSGILLAVAVWKTWRGLRWLARRGSGARR